MFSVGRAGDCENRHRRGRRAETDVSRTVALQYGFGCHNQVLSVSIGAGSAAPCRSSSPRVPAETMGWGGRSPVVPSWRVPQLVRPDVTSKPPTASSTFDGPVGQGIQDRPADPGNRPSFRLNYRNRSRGESSTVHVGNLVVKGVPSVSVPGVTTTGRSTGRDLETDDQITRVDRSVHLQRPPLRIRPDSRPVRNP